MASCLGLQARLRSQMFAPCSDLDKDLIVARIQGHPEELCIVYRWHRQLICPDHSVRALHIWPEPVPPSIAAPPSSPPGPVSVPLSAGHTAGR